MTIPNGVFPAVGLSGGSGLLAVRQGDPRVPGWIVVYRFAQSNPDALTETWRSSLPAGSPCFPGLYVLDGLTWLAFHDGSRQHLRNMATGDEQSYYGLSNPSAFGGGYFAYTDPRQPYKVYRVNLRTGDVDQPRLGAPTGLSRILDDGMVRTIDEDRVLEGPHTSNPRYAGALAVCEYDDDATRMGCGWRVGSTRGLLWPGLLAFTPYPAADGDTQAIATAGSGSVRLFCGSLAELIAASAPPIQKEPGPIVNVPPPNPIPVPEPSRMPEPVSPFSWSSLQIVGESPDVRAWAETTRLTRVSLSAEGVALDFEAKARWPDVTSPGWDGPLQYTLWFAQCVNGQWYATGVIEYWRGLVAYGGDVTAPTQFGANWVYFASPLRQPAIGETIGFFVTAGDQRRKDVHAVAERSNLVTFPWNGRADVFTFGDAPTPVPAPAPGPSPTPTPGDTGELAALRAEVAQLTQTAHDAEATIADLRRQLDPATAMPNYDQTLAMIQRADAAFQAAQKAKKKTLLYPAACAHLTWRYLREGYTIEQLLADAAERGR